MQETTWTFEVPSCHRCEGWQRHSGRAICTGENRLCSKSRQTEGMAGADQHRYIAFSRRDHSDLRQKMGHRSLFQSMQITSPAQDGMPQSFL